MFESGLFGTGTCMGTKSLGRLIRRLKVLLRTGKSSQMYISPFGTVSLCGECTA